METTVRSAPTAPPAPPAPWYRSAAAADLLTGAQAGDLLAAALAADGAGLESWRVHQVHARPGAEVSVGYDVVARRGRSAPEYLVATTAALPAAAARHGVVRLDDGPRSVHVWRHPVDPLLPGLATACDAAALGELLARSPRTRGEVPDVVTSVEMVAYRPLRRAVLRARLRRGPVESPVDSTVYVKVVRPDTVRDLVARHELFDGRTPAAPVVRTWSADGVVVLQEAAGQSLAQHLAATAPGDQASAIDPQHLLDTLTTLPAGALDLTRRPAWAERTAHYARAARTTHGLDAERVDRLERAVRAIVDDVDAGPVVPTHGDYYEANIVLDGDRVRTLLDVDTLGPGHLVDDLACLVGHLAVLPSLAPDVYGGAAGLVARCLETFDRAVDPRSLRARAAAVVLSLAASTADRRLAHTWCGVAEEFLRTLSSSAPAALTRPDQAVQHTATTRSSTPGLPPPAGAPRLEGDE
ncbi:aminoglycoside phosphotransferase family protein [Oerskovia flava]|uniref:aminoglycoside phosphotransferase family protein n=1 Tax=Oerskovia flava TaxID=2986422 RepID=UPI00223F181C|nr:aminoglycoside phosphotransferase family protein [Oerskovia sp. JB1-3-2]